VTSVIICEYYSFFGENFLTFVVVPYSFFVQFFLLPDTHSGRFSARFGHCRPDLSSLALISVGVHASHHSWLNFVLGSPGFWLRFPVRRRLLRFLPTRLDSGSASAIPGLHFSSSSIGLSTGQLLVPSFGPLLRSAGRFSLSHRQVSFP
jgi:hypothetical protein